VHMEWNEQAMRSPLTWTKKASQLLGEQSVMYFGELKVANPIRVNEDKVVVSVTCHKREPR
jgi:hypothetical protein